MLLGGVPGFNNHFTYSHAGSRSNLGAGRASCPNDDHVPCRALCRAPSPYRAIRCSQSRSETWTHRHPSIRGRVGLPTSLTDTLPARVVKLRASSGVENGSPPFRREERRRVVGRTGNANREPLFCGDGRRSAAVHSAVRTPDDDHARRPLPKSWTMSAGSFHQNVVGIRPPGAAKRRRLTLVAAEGLRGSVAAARHVRSACLRRRAGRRCHGPRRGGAGTSHTLVAATR